MNRSRQYLDEQAVIKRAAQRGLPDTPSKVLIRSLVRIAVLFIVTAVVWLLIVMAFHLEVRP